MFPQNMKTQWKKKNNKRNNSTVVWVTMLRTFSNISRNIMKATEKLSTAHVKNIKKLQLDRYDFFFTKFKIPFNSPDFLNLVSYDILITACGFVIGNSFFSINYISHRSCLLRHFVHKSFFFRINLKLRLKTCSMDK